MHVKNLSLLEDDTHWDDALADASISASPHQIPTFFAILLSTCFPSDPVVLWNKYSDDITEDILYRVRRTTSRPDLPFLVEMYNDFDRRHVFDDLW